MTTMARDRPGWSQTPGTPPVSPTWVAEADNQATLGCFLRCIIMELDRKWSRQVSNQHPRGSLATVGSSLLCCAITAPLFSLLWAHSSLLSIQALKHTHVTLQVFYMCAIYVCVHICLYTYTHIYDIKFPAHKDHHFCWHYIWHGTLCLTELYTNDKLPINYSWFIQQISLGKNCKNIRLNVHNSRTNSCMKTIKTREECSMWKTASKSLWKIEWKGKFIFDTKQNWDPRLDFS